MKIQRTALRYLPKNNPKQLVTLTIDDFVYQIASEPYEYVQFSF